MKKLSAQILITLTAAAGTSQAFEVEHKAHVHGHAQLSVAMEGHDLAIELQSPAANIVGFEHQPSTKEQRKAVKEAAKHLQEADELFILSSDAECELEKVKVESPLLAGIDDKDHKHDDHHEEHDHHDHGHKKKHDHDEHDDHHHDHHDHGHKKKHAHDEHEHDHHKDHDHHDHSDHEGHDHDEEAHSEFHAHYHFHCENIKALNEIDVKIFEHFSGFEEIEAQVISTQGQQRNELSPGNSKITL